MQAIRDAIVAILAEDWPMTVRQMFYRLVSAGIVAKSEGEYKSTVVRLLTEMRRAREVDFGMIADNTRWQRKPRTYSSLEQALLRSAECYRRSLWDNQEAYVEVWLEKDALAGVLLPVTSEWDVPLMVTRGYSSISFLHSAAEAIDAAGKPAYLYYLGDLDPSGLDITRAVESGIREFAPGADIRFERVAVTGEQVEALALPTRPTKATDSRSKNFAGESVEVDAIPPRLLRDIVSGCIERHIDRRALAELKRVEALERETFGRIASCDLDIFKDDGLWGDD